MLYCELDNNDTIYNWLYSKNDAAFVLQKKPV